MVSGVEERGWFSAAATAMRDKVKTGQDDACVHPESVGNVPEEPRQWCGFEYADKMEQGLGPGLTTRFIEASPADDAIEQRMLMFRSQNRLTWTLATEHSKPLLIAKVKNQGTRFEIYIADEGSPSQTNAPANALGPAFVLQGNSAQTRWSLSSSRCQLCEIRGKRKCGSREFARISHYIENVGEGQAFCMDVELPQAAEDGSPAVLCDVCGDAKASFCNDLSTRRPRWNEKHKSLTLDFRGRVTMASAKNFQLEARSQPNKVRFLFGKVGTHNFVLDFRNPLGPIQAFATALTAAHWK